MEMAIFNIQRAITLKVGKQELRFMCSACRLMVFDICVKFHEKYQEVLKLMSRHENCQHPPHTHTQRKDEKLKKYTPLHTSYAGGITRVMVHVFCMLSHGLTFV